MLRYLVWSTLLWKHSWLLVFLISFSSGYAEALKWRKVPPCCVYFYSTSSWSQSWARRSILTWNLNMGERSNDNDRIWHIIERFILFNARNFTQCRTYSLFLCFCFSFFGWFKSGLKWKGSTSSSMLNLALLFDVLFTKCVWILEYK